MHSNRRQLRLIAALFCSWLLAGCTPERDFSDLQAFVAEVDLRPGTEVEPVPEFEPYEGFMYGAAAMRSPFEVPLVLDAQTSEVLDQDVEPDFDRIAEPLENHSLSELRMVGMLRRSGVYEALIEDAFGEVHRARVGDYMGRNYGRIRNISQSQLNIMEIVPSGSGGWVERPQTLTLQ